jgi:hypothetical protein
LRLGRLSVDVKEVRRRVAQVRAFADIDDESAHAEEDGLYHAVLKAIARGAPDAPALARAALRTSTIRFGRWCG